MYFIWMWEVSLSLSDLKSHFIWMWKVSLSLSDLKSHFIWMWKVSLSDFPSIFHLDVEDLYLCQMKGYFRLVYTNASIMPGKLV